MTEKKTYAVMVARTESKAVVYVAPNMPPALASWFARTFEANMTAVIGPRWADEVEAKAGRRWDAPLKYADVFLTMTMDSTAYWELSRGWSDTFGDGSPDSETKKDAREFAKDVIADDVCFCGRAGTHPTHDGIYLCEDHHQEWIEAGRYVVGGWIENAIATGYEQEVRFWNRTKVMIWADYGTPEFTAAAAANNGISNRRWYKPF